MPSFHPLHRTFAIGALALGAAVGAHAQNRLPTIPPAQYTPAQQDAAKVFLEARKTPVFGPFEPMMYSPDLMNLARAMGDHLRYKSAVGTSLSELAILVTARHWRQDYEWYVHQPIAVKVGISPATTDAIANGLEPTDMSADQQLVYRFATELNRTGRVSDATYHAAEARFGKPGVVDLAGICGYYTFLAMQLNMARYPIPADGKPLPVLAK